MALDLMPIRAARHAELSRLENVLLPTRQLTPRETVVYNKMSDDWARLDATEKTAAYAALLQGRLSEALRLIFLGSMDDHYRHLDNITDSRKRSVFEPFSETLTQMDGEFAWEVKTVTRSKMTAIVTEPYPDGVPRQNFWRRMMGWTS